MSKFVGFLIVTVFACAFSLLEVIATPPITTTNRPTTHIVSYVHQKRVQTKSDEFSEFDLESFKGTTGAVEQLFGRFMQRLDTKGIATTTKLYPLNITKGSDDLANSQQNTLESTNEIFGSNNAVEQHESPMMDDVMAMANTSDDWNRVKQSIPVLEPVKHLLNTVRDGTFNHTAHARNRHHQLVSSGNGNHSPHHNDSAAIETEEEREMVNESTGFKLLEMLGTVAGMFWGFFSNIQKVFAASSGGASAALSGSSSQ